MPKLDLPRDHIRGYAEGVDVCPLVGDLQHVGPVGDHPPTDLLHVLPGRPPRQTNALDPLGDQDVQALQSLATGSQTTLKIENGRREMS